MEHGPHSAPPEGVTAGESVPTGSEPDRLEETTIQRMKHHLKAHHPAGMEMSDDELRERAIERLHEMQVSI